MTLGQTVIEIYDWLTLRRLNERRRRPIGQYVVIGQNALWVLPKNYQLNKREQPLLNTNHLWRFARQTITCCLVVIRQTQAGDATMNKKQIMILINRVAVSLQGGSKNTPDEKV